MNTVNSYLWLAETYFLFLNTVEILKISFILTRSEVWWEKELTTSNEPNLFF